MLLMLMLMLLTWDIERGGNRGDNANEERNGDIGDGGGEVIDAFPPPGGGEKGGEKIFLPPTPPPPLFTPLLGFGASGGTPGAVLDVGCGPTAI